MSVNALFDPGIFLISDELWNIDSSRTDFLDRLDRHLEFIDFIGIGKILWTDEYDERLWSYPQLAPWKESRDWSIRLSQILYVNLSKHTRRIDISQQIPAESYPSLQCHCPYAKEAFHKLVNAVINIVLTPHFCISVLNDVDQDQSFRSSNSAQWLQFPVVKHPDEWPGHIEPTQLFWPTTRNDKEAFEKCIKLTAMKKNIDPARLHKFRLTPNFLGDLITSSRRERVVEMIVQRLNMTLQEAARDPQLQDEVLGSGVRRFRVTPRPSSLRIHYNISNNDIVFDRFFDEGHHDDGL